jgi:hypothetical protein
MQKEKKRYRIQSGCPQCGCSFTTVLTKEELQERYGNVPNFDLECSACGQVHGIGQGRLPGMGRRVPHEGMSGPGERF